MSNQVDVASDTSDTFYTGSQTIGTTPVQFNRNGAQNINRGVQFKAASGNAGSVYIGKASVTADTDPERDGFPIDANQGQFVPVSDVDQIYLLASEAGQKIFWMAT